MLGQNQNAPGGCEGPENLGIKGTVVFVAIYLNSCLRGSRTRRLAASSIGTHAFEGVATSASARVQQAVGAGWLRCVPGESLPQVPSNALSLSCGDVNAGE